MEVDARRAEEGQREGRVEGCVDGAIDAQPTKVFAGLMETRIRCSGCGSCSSTSETFLDLTLPVPAERTGGDAAREGAGRVTQGNVCLEELVAEVLREEEVLRGEEVLRVLRGEVVLCGEEVLHEERELLHDVGGTVDEAGEVPPPPSGQAAEYERFMRELGG